MNGRAGGGATAQGYASVKQHIMDRIRSGELRPGDRVPSEHELVDALGVSRMTVNRALRELSADGTVIRRKGLGSFVAMRNNPAYVFEVGNIAEEIRARGNSHGAETFQAEAESAPEDIAGLFGLERGAAVFHVVIVHKENGLPVQLEDRYVNPGIVPDFLGHDFTRETPNEILMKATPWSLAEHRIEAVLPQPWEARLLGLGAFDPCLAIRRRTYASAPATPREGGEVVSIVRLLIPGGRGHIESRRVARPQD